MPNPALTPDGTCPRCHGITVLYRQDCGSHGLSLPCPDCPIAVHDDYDDLTTDCANCGGEGFTYGCSWDWQCDVAPSRGRGLKHTG